MIFLTRNRASLAKGWSLLCKGQNQPRPVVAQTAYLRMRRASGLESDSCKGSAFRITTSATGNTVGAIPFQGCVRLQTDARFRRRAPRRPRAERGRSLERLAKIRAGLGGGPAAIRGGALSFRPWQLARHLPESGYIQTLATRIKSFIPWGLGSEVDSTKSCLYETECLFRSGDNHGLWWFGCLRVGPTSGARPTETNPTGMVPAMKHTVLQIVESSRNAILDELVLPQEVGTRRLRTELSKLFQEKVTAFLMAT